jgi:hypothetical protein
MHWMIVEAARTAGSKALKRARPELSGRDVPAGTITRAQMDWTGLRRKEAARLKPQFDTLIQGTNTPPAAGSGIDSGMLFGNSLGQAEKAANPTPL